MKWTVSFAAILLSSALQSASADFLMSQIGPNSSTTDGQGGPASQRFEAGFTAFNIVAIDDFTLTQRASLTSLSAVLSGFNGFTTANYANVQNWQVSIYSSPAAAGSSGTNLTGDVANLTFSPGAITLTPFGTNNAGALFTADLSSSGVSLAPGTYWIGLTPRVDFGGNGQVAIENSIFAGFPSNANSMQANPGGGFGFGPLNAVNSNLAYDLQGTLTPVPPTFLVGMVAVPVLALVRKRK
jgi:hypothetical protein